MIAFGGDTTRMASADATSATCPGARWGLVCMGGASTFCGSIPMDQSWPEVLERLYGERYGSLEALIE
jgi:hypothetical protein